MGIYKGLDVREWASASAGRTQGEGFDDTVFFFSDFFSLVLLGIEAQDLCMLGKHSSTELHLQPMTKGSSFSVSSLIGCAFSY